MIRTFNFICIVLLLFSCKKTSDTVPEDDSCTIDIVSQLRNPYLFPAEPSLHAQPTHRYVKFRLKTIGEYRNLEAQGVFLLDHPFDAVPDKNLQYQTEHTHQTGVYFGVVPVGVDISTYAAEQLADLYMPETPVNGKITDTEAKEFRGTVKFFDPIDSTLVPLESAKIILRNATRTVTALTDKDGNFSVATSLLLTDTIEVLIKFDNDFLEIHTLDLASLSAVFGTNIYSLGYKKSCAFTNLNIEIGRQMNNAALHHSCAALHSLNKFKKFAAEFGYLVPDKKFLFWLGKEAPISTSYAAPMLRNMAMQNISNPQQLLTNLFGVPADLAGILSFIIQDQLPDIYAPYYIRFATAARASFIETMFHELAHASHYAKVGPAFWMPYVEYIYGNGGYGEPAFTNSGIVGLSESWAEDLSNICAYYTYGKSKYLDWNEHPIEDWIPYGVYHDLYDEGAAESFDKISGFTFPQLYGFLTTDTRSVEALKLKAKNTVPAQHSDIDELFEHYGY
jgi:hypothetical protein